MTISRTARRRLGPAVALLAVLATAAFAPPAASAAQPQVTTSLGTSVTLAGEQVHTVVAAEQWYGSGLWIPKPGDISITVRVKVRAVKRTSTNPLYYTLRDRRGREWRGTIIGTRSPRLTSTNTLGPGRTNDGWLTFNLPRQDASNLQLVYRMRYGFGPKLTVRVGTPTLQTGALAQTVPILDEHTLTVLEAGTWISDGMWQPKPGNTAFTVHLRIAASKPTPVGRFSLLHTSGELHGWTYLGSRDPDLEWKLPLASGDAVDGWLTFIVPTGHVNALTLVYHVHQGAGPTVTVPLPAA